MVPAVDDEAGGADDVHTLVERRLAIHPPKRKQEIGQEDQAGPEPAGRLYQDQLRAQTARFRRT